MNRSCRRIRATTDRGVHENRSEIRRALWPNCGRGVYMATISKKGKSWQFQIRRVGQKPICKTFVRHFFNVSGLIPNMVATSASVMQSARKAAAAGPCSAGGRRDIASTTSDVAWCPERLRREGFGRTAWRPPAATWRTDQPGRRRSSRWPPPATPRPGTRPANLPTRAVHGISADIA